MERSPLDELCEARRKLEAARTALGTLPELAALAERLERAAGEVRRIERLVDDAKPGAIPSVSR